MEEFISFIKLYFHEDYSELGFFGVGMAFLYVNAIFYMIDFYGLVKRKSKAETWAILAIPCVVSVMGSAVAAWNVRVPEPGKLGGFLRALESSSLNRMLLLVGVFYWLLWSLTFASQSKLFLSSNSSKRSKKDIRRWVLSCILDYIYVAMIFFFSLWHQLLGKSFFAEGREFFLWLYLYAIYFLCCKILLLAAALLIRLYSVRITIFKWKEGKNPSTFLFRYFLFYQNAMVRNLLLLGLVILAPIVYVIIWEERSYELILAIGFVTLIVVFLILLSAGPGMKSLEKFQVWGDSRHMKEMFCQEYFIQEPVYKNKDYTVTRHFLIDEQQACTFYYLPALGYIGAWGIDKDGRNKEVWFMDGGRFKISEQEEENMAPVIEYVAKWQKGHEYSFERSKKIFGKTKSTYEELVKGIIVIVIMAFAIFPHLMDIF